MSEKTTVAVATVRWFHAAVKHINSECKYLAKRKLAQDFIHHVVHSSPAE